MWGGRRGAGERERYSEWWEGERGEVGGGREGMVLLFRPPLTPCTPPPIILLGIVSYMRQEATPATIEVKTIKEAKKLVRSEFGCVMGFFVEEGGEELLNTYTITANMVRDAATSFGFTREPEVAKAFAIKSNTVAAILPQRLTHTHTHARTHTHMRTHTRAHMHTNSHTHTHTHTHTHCTQCHCLLILGTNQTMNKQ